jgi:hypothetical protein
MMPIPSSSKRIKGGGDAPGWNLAKNILIGQAQIHGLSKLDGKGGTWKGVENWVRKLINRLPRMYWISRKKH